MIARFESFVTGITICYKYIQRIKSTEMTELGLKGTHAMCLFFLHHNPEGLTASQLCSLCAEDKAAISRTVAELRRAGLVGIPSAKTYRAPLLLTAQGETVAHRVDSLIEGWVSAGGCGLDPRQRDAFYDTLSLIAANLRAHMEGNNSKN